MLYRCILIVAYCILYHCILILLSNEKCITNATTVNLLTNNETSIAITGQKYELVRNEIMCSKVNELSTVKSQ